MKAALPLQSGCGTAELAGMTYIGALGVACVCCLEIVGTHLSLESSPQAGGCLGPRLLLLLYSGSCWVVRTTRGYGGGMGEWDGGLELGPVDGGTGDSMSA